MNVWFQRPTSLILEGPSRTGKMTWARSLGSHNYICGHLDFNLATFHNDVLYNIIDDVAPSYLRLKHWRELIDAQQAWKINCKYSKPVWIKRGISSILICNLRHDSRYKEYLDRPNNLSLRDWTLQNVQFEFIKSLLYHAPNNPDDNGDLINESSNLHSILAGSKSYSPFYQWIIGPRTWSGRRRLILRFFPRRWTILCISMWKSISTAV